MPVTRSAAAKEARLKLPNDAEIKTTPATVSSKKVKKAPKVKTTPVVVPSMFKTPEAETTPLLPSKDIKTTPEPSKFKTPEAKIAKNTYLSSKKTVGVTMSNIKNFPGIKVNEKV
jgi:endonuclease/exonuclease/phosphatase (EEP) superfamily protein YafD